MGIILCVEFQKYPFILKKNIEDLGHTLKDDFFHADMKFEDLFSLKSS